MDLRPTHECDEKARLTFLRKKLPNFSQHLLEHRRRKASSLSILLAGMVGAEKPRQAARQRETGPVGEAEHRAGREIFALRSHHS